jgi:hypothetical protein
VDHRTDLLNYRTAFKIELHHLDRKGADKTNAAEGCHNRRLGKTIALTTLHDLANLPHLTISIKLADRRTKHYS